MLVITVRLPVVAMQLTAKLVEAALPAGTLTVRELPPLTVQFPAMPESPTVWLPAGSPENVTLPFVAIARLWAPSTVTE